MVLRETQDNYWVDKMRKDTLWEKQNLLQKIASTIFAFSVRKTDKEIDDFIRRYVEVFAELPPFTFIERPVNSDWVPHLFEDTFDFTTAADLEHPTANEIFNRETFVRRFRQEGNQERRRAMVSVHHLQRRINIACTNHGKLRFLDRILGVSLS